MTTRLIDLDGVTVPFAADDVPPPGARVSALLAARVVDEITGRPPLASIAVRADIAGTARVSTGGVVGVAGVPREVFPALASQDYKQVALTVEAEGFLPRTKLFDVPQDTNFPATYAPPAIDDLAVHRAPVVIEGRVAQLAGGVSTPLVGARVRVTGVWRQAPGANVVVPPDPPDLVALDPPLQADRPAASTTVTPVPLPPVALDTRELLLDVPPGTTRLHVSNALGIVAPGTFVDIDAGDVERVEYGEVVGIEAATTADQPAWITLALPVARPHRTGAEIRRVTPGAAGAARAVARDAAAVDPVLFLANVGGLTAGDTFTVTTVGPPQPPPDEYHRVSMFDVVTDADGYYRLPPLSRVAQLTVRAQFGALAPVDRELRADFTQRSQRLDFVLT